MKKHPGWHKDVDITHQLLWQVKQTQLEKEIFNLLSVKWRGVVRNKDLNFNTFPSVVLASQAQLHSWLFYFPYLQLMEDGEWGELSVPFLPFTFSACSSVLSSHGLQSYNKHCLSSMACSPCQKTFLCGALSVTQRFYKAQHWHGCCSPGAAVWISALTWSPPLAGEVCLNGMPTCSGLMLAGFQAPTKATPLLPFTPQLDRRQIYEGSWVEIRMERDHSANRCRQNKLDLGILTEFISNKRKAEQDNKK